MRNRKDHTIMSMDRRVIREIHNQESNSSSGLRKQIWAYTKRLICCCLNPEANEPVHEQQTLHDGPPVSNEIELRQRSIVDKSHEAIIGQWQTALQEDNLKYENTLVSPNGLRVQKVMQYR